MSNIALLSQIVPRGVSDLEYARFTLRVTAVPTVAVLPSNRNFIHRHSTVKQQAGRSSLRTIQSDFHSSIQRFADYFEYRAAIRYCLCPGIKCT